MKFGYALCAIMLVAAIVILFLPRHERSDASDALARQEEQAQVAKSEVAPQAAAVDPHAGEHRTVRVDGLTYHIVGGVINDGTMLRFTTVEGMAVTVVAPYDVVIEGQP